MLATVHCKPAARTVQVMGTELTFTVKNARGNVAREARKAATWAGEEAEAQVSKWRENIQAVDRSSHFEDPFTMAPPS